VILSSDVRAAAVLSGGRPLVALAPTLAEQLTAADLDRVLVHEWAHIQRRDDVTQVLQQLVRVVIGWHPAAWWLERQIEFEREAACDEFAVAVTGSAKGYAACLATLAALPAPHAALPALAAVTPSRLRARVTRILAVPRVAAVRPWRAIALVAGVALGACTLAIGQVRLVALEVATGVIETASSSVLAQRVVQKPTAAGPQAPSDAARVTSVARTLSDSRGEPDKARPTDVNAVPIAVEPEPDATEPTGELPSIDSALIEPSPSALIATVPVEPGLAATAEAAGPAPASAPTVTDLARGTWTRATGTGVAIGRASSTAGKATGSFFSRLGKKIATSF
jgi:hypothetical protein